MTTLLEENLDAVDPAVVHWSTGTILTIFFASSLVAALFFGLGFTFGPAQTSNFIANQSSNASATPRTSEPLAQTSFTSGSANRDTVLRHAPKSSPEELNLQVVSAEKLHSPATTLPEAKPRLASHADATDKAAATQASSSRYMVQVGAIGNRKDAQMLVSRLHSQGFRAGIYPGKRDKFLHVQLGPFATAQQAQAVRRRVIAHGHHALLKPAA